MGRETTLKYTAPGPVPVETQPVMSESGHQRQIGDVRDESGSPPIAPEWAHRSNNGLGQGTKSLRDSPLTRVLEPIGR